MNFTFQLNRFKEFSINLDENEKKNLEKKTTHYLLKLPQSVECFFYVHRI